MERCQQIVSDIDKVLDEPPVNIEDSLIQAVLAHRMTPEEANECLEAYLKNVKNSQGGLGV